MNPAHYILAVAAMAGILIGTANEDILAGICFLVMAITVLGFIGAVVTWVIINLVKTLK